MKLERDDFFSFLEISSIYIKYAYFKKDNVFVYDKDVRYEEKRKEDRKTFKKEWWKKPVLAVWGVILPRVSVILLNSFLKCLLNHLDLSVHWKSKKLPGSVLLIRVSAQIGADPDSVL